MGKTKYIDAEPLINALRRLLDKGELIIGVGEIMYTIKDTPAADVVEVVRCKDCKYQDKGENDCEAWNLCGYRPWLHIPTEDDAFCSKGDRKDG